MATILDDPVSADEFPLFVEEGGEPRRRKVAKAIDCLTSKQFFYSIAFF